MTKIRQTPITKSARGQECQIRIPFVCNFNNETTVWCHGNGLAAGKGYGLKSHDALGSYGCSSCHAVVDGIKPVKHLTKNEIEICFHEGHQRSLLILIDKGLVKV